MNSEVTYPRRVAVTGAASGIGKATEILLRERGSEVVAVDVNAAGLAEAAASGAETVACDITSADDRARLYEAAGEIDGLVNAAGIIRRVPIPGVRVNAVLPGHHGHSDAGQGARRRALPPARGAARAAAQIGHPAEQGLRARRDRRRHRVPALERRALRHGQALGVDGSLVLY